MKFIPRRQLAVAGAVAGGIALAGSFGFAPSDPPDALRIEEDWQLVLNEPRTEVSAPQFHTVMAPGTSMNGLYFQVTWNYRDLPDFAEGGLQMQVWNGESDFASREVGSDSLSNDAETVSWTARLSTDTAHVTFSIVNGHSSSWGSFGGESMTVRTAKPVANLNSYDAGTSAANSWITYGSNRVQRLVLLRTRKYDGAGNLIGEDNTQHVIFQQDDGGGL